MGVWAWPGRLAAPTAHRAPLGKARALGICSGEASVWPCPFAPPSGVPPGVGGDCSPHRSPALEAPGLPTPRQLGSGSPSASLLRPSPLGQGQLGTAAPSPPSGLRGPRPPPTPQAGPLQAQRSHPRDGGSRRLPLPPGRHPQQGRPGTRGPSPSPRRGTGGGSCDRNRCPVLRCGRSWGQGGGGVTTLRAETGPVGGREHRGPWAHPEGPWKVGGAGPALSRTPQGPPARCPRPL